MIRLVGVAIVVCLGLMLAGCDKCGNWPFMHTQSCRGGTGPGGVQ
jgi:hypothetical protein